MVIEVVLVLGVSVEVIFVCVIIMCVINCKF